MVLDGWKPMMLLGFLSFVASFQASAPTRPLVPGASKCRNLFQLSWYLSDFMMTNYDQKPLSRTSPANVRKRSSDVPRRTMVEAYGTSGEDISKIVNIQSWKKTKILFMIQWNLNRLVKVS